MFYPWFKRFRTLLYNTATTSGLHHLSRLISPTPLTSHYHLMSPDCLCFLYYVIGFSTKPLLCPCVHTTAGNMNCTVFSKHKHFAPPKSVCFANVIELYNNFGLWQNFCLHCSHNLATKQLLILKTVKC